MEISNNRYDNSYEYFSTGRVVEHKQGDVVCKVLRTEGGLLENVPLLGLYGVGGQNTNIFWKGSLLNNFVVLLKVNGIYCVLTTIPDFATLSQMITMGENKNLPSAGSN